MLAGSCMAVHRESATFCLCVCSFVICCSCFVVFGTHFAFLDPTLGSFWVRLDSAWITLGRPIRVQWGSPWAA